MVIGYSIGAGALALMGQLGQPDAGALIDQEMAAVNADPLVNSVVQIANDQLASGASPPTVIALVAAMPVIYLVSKSVLAMVDREHELSVSKRRRAAGLDGLPGASE